MNLYYIMSIFNSGPDKYTNVDIDKLPQILIDFYRFFPIFTAPEQH